MADGSFASTVSRDRNANAQTNTIWVRLSDDTTALAIDGSGYITSNINGTVTVSASDLDIRDIVHTQDDILIYANTAKDGTGTDYVPLVDADGKLIISNPGSGTEYTEDVVAPQPASGIANVVERDDVLATITPAEGDWSKLYCNSLGALWVAVSGEVAINDGGNTITVDGTVAVSSVAGNVTVVATDLDIRDLTHVSDSVAIGDGTETLNITAAGEAEVDIAAQSLTALKVSKDANANSETNPIYVNVVTAPTSGSEIHDYDTAAAVASDASDNHDYTVTGTTFFLKSVIVSGSGNIKFEIQVGPVLALVTKAVGFLQGREGDTQQVNFSPAIEVPVTSTGTVRIIRTNRQGAATDLYSTIIGNDV